MRLGIVPPGHELGANHGDRSKNHSDQIYLLIIPTGVELQDQRSLHTPLPRSYLKYIDFASSPTSYPDRRLISTVGMPHPYGI